VSRLRLRPAALILGLLLLWLGRVWLLGDLIRQERVIRTLGGAGLALILLSLWWLLGSRAPARARVGGFLAFLCVGGLGAGLFRIRGVTGDLVPILESRLERPSVPLATPPPRPAQAPRPAPETKAAFEPVPETVASGPPAPRPHARVFDYPQFLGPSRDATIRGLRLARDWAARPPRPLWRHSISPAWSGFAVSGNWAVTQEQQGEDEVVTAYALGTGALVWRHSDRARYATTIAGEGPRATPTVQGDRVYTLGATGILNALELHTGRRVWSRDVVGENGGQVPDWGKSCSPLLLDGLVIVSAGGHEGRSLVAYHAETGELAWSGGSDGSSYSSPVAAEILGRRQVLIFNRASVASHDPATGAVLWEHPWPAEQPNVSQPLPLPGDRVLFSSGYGIGSKAFQVSIGDDGALAASLAWETPRLKAKFANLVLHRGFVYGLDDGVLACLDAADGQRRWREGRYGHGQVLLVDDLLLVQTEEGELVLVEPKASALTELTRFSALDGKTWNPPALAGPILLVRNDREAAAYELPEDASPPR
jgi:outer membrane protein assembly factor BamB